jgi:hypothetical protein
MSTTTLTHLLAMVLAGVGSIVLALFGKIPGTDAYALLLVIAGVTGTTAAISTASPAPPTTGKVAPAAPAGT